MLHAWWGLNPCFKQLCDMLAGNGFTVLAPDLFKGSVASTVEQAQGQVDGQDAEFIGRTIHAAKERLASLTSGKVALVGFSFGGAWALVSAAEEPDIAAVVLFYSVYGVDFARVKGKVLGHFAELDQWEPLEGVRDMETDMKAAGVDTSFHIYPGASHWFVEEDRPEYDSGAAQAAWKRTIDFLRKNL
jgi:carboxymethylenebutenolidase